MFCPKCGTHCADDAKFCKSCGASLGAPSAPAGAAPSAPASGPAMAIPPAYGSAMAAVASPSAAAMKPRRSIAPFIAIAAIAAVAIIAIVVFVVKPFGSASTDEETNNIDLGGGTVTAADGWDYFCTSDGLYRAKTDGTVETIISIPINEDGVHKYGISNLSADNGYLFFTKYSKYSSGSVCRMATDGTDEKTLFAGSESSEKEYTEPWQLYVYDHKLYLLLYESTSEKGTYRIITMDEDGANQQELCTVDAAAGWYNTSTLTSTIITPEKVLRLKNCSNGDDHTVEIYAQNLDGTGVERIYRSSEGGMSWPVISGNTLIFSEEDHLTSMNVDGSDVKTLYQGSTYFTPLTVADGYVYLSDEQQLARLPISGGNLETLNSDARWQTLELASVANGHLVVESRNSIAAVGLDGEELATYINYDTSG